MRLSSDQQRVIREQFSEIFGDGEIYLFGSRADDEKRGGDIDLYLKPYKQYNDVYDKKIKFLVQLEKYLGDQKIDVVIARDKDRLIEQEALRSGVLIENKNYKIKKYLHQCDKHQKWIEKAYNDVKPILPLSLKSYQQLRDEDVRSIDQYLFRFAKLQDTIGEKLFKMIVSDFAEDVSRLSFIDILNRLEKVGILDSVEEWRSLRNARNNIAHQYDDEPEETADALNKIFAQKDLLIGIYRNIRDYYAKLS